MVAKLLKRTGVTVWGWVVLYKAVVQMVLLYRREVWVVAGAMLKVPEGFHHRTARRIVGNTAWRTVDREWKYIPVEDTL